LKLFKIFEYLFERYTRKRLYLSIKMWLCAVLVLVHSLWSTMAPSTGKIQHKQGTIKLLLIKKYLVMVSFEISPNYSIQFKILNNSSIQNEKKTFVQHYTYTLVLFNRLFLLSYSRFASHFRVVES